MKIPPRVGDPAAVVLILIVLFLFIDGILSNGQMLLGILAAFLVGWFINLVQWFKSLE